MAKLYPPRIPSTIPAFELKRSGQSTIAVPFSLNRLTGKDEIGNFILKIKEIQSNKEILLLYLEVNEENSSKIDYDNGILYFDIPSSDMLKETLKKGQFYKIQLAHQDLAEAEDNRTTLYYSDVGVVKATGYIDSWIDGLSVIENSYNFANWEFIGKYRNADQTEKLYSSRFIIYDMFGDVFEDSGEIIHNNAEKGTVDYNNHFLTDESYKRKKELNPNEYYSIIWYYTTVNGLKSQSVEYPLVSRELKPELKAELIATLNQDEGYINLALQTKQNKDGSYDTAIGNYVITRKSSKYPDVWDTIFKFDLREEVPTRQIWVDNTVEQGITYTYGIQQYSQKGVHTSRIESKSVLVDFEHMFLSDSDRQLKIAFNPKVSSFKPVVLETKTDTIGGKHPFIYRNGDVYYHEIPISGLISCQLDDSNLFTKEDELSEIISSLEKIHDHSTKVIAKERLFKREVLSWLTNGKPKILRTPTEGNFIVQLMNVSLSPMDQLGRMLHTFSATGYEIDDFSFENIVKLNLLNKLQEDKDTNILFNTLTYSPSNASTISISNIQSIQIADAIPGTKFKIIYNQKVNDPKEITIKENNDDTTKVFIKSNDIREIVINTTGTYNYFSDSVFTFEIENNVNMGTIVYGFKSEATNDFENIEKVLIEYIPCQTLSSKINTDIDETTNLIEILKTFFRKEDQIQFNIFYQMDFYQVEEGLDYENYYIRLIYDNEEFDENQDQIFVSDSAQTINIKHVNKYHLENIKNISAIYIASGVGVNLSYEATIIQKVGATNDN